MKVDFLTVISGNRFCLDEWLDYIKDIPFQKHGDTTWVIVDNSADPVFSEILNEGMASRNLEEKFSKIIRVTGPGKYVPPKGKDWRDPEVCLGKHRSTGEAFTLGFSLCSGDLAYTVDDDVIPQQDSFDKLMKITDDEVGVSSGLYFNHSGWNLTNAGWKTGDELKRIVVASVNKQNWVPALIDDFLGNGVVDSGYVGTGCAIWKTEQVRRCLPLKSIVRKYGVLGPDGYLCEKLRELGKTVLVESSVFCLHREDSKSDELTTETPEELRTAVIVGSYGDLDDRFNTYRNVRNLAEKFNYKVIVVWPRNSAKGGNCPWVADGIVAEVKYFEEDAYCKRYKQTKDMELRRKLAFTDIYNEMVDSDKYDRVINLLKTTEELTIEEDKLGAELEITLRGIQTREILGDGEK